MSANGQPSARSAHIDVLRGLSIAAVLLLHFSLTYHLVDSPLSAVLPAWLIGAATVNGNYGVTVFFTISGFLITSNTLRRYGSWSQVRLRHFYALRCARILPPLMMVLLIIVPLAMAGQGSFADSGDGRDMPPAMLFWAVLSVLTFWHNVLMQAYGYFNYCLNIYWSLSVEEGFYLVFPLACIALKRTSRIVVLCILCVVAGPCYRYLHRTDELYFMYGYPACFDAIACGCLAALASARWRWRGRELRLMHAGAYAGLIGAFLWGIDGHEVFGFTAVALCAAVLLLDGLAAPSIGARRLPLRILAWLGRHSYELYLFHIVVLAAMRDWVPRARLAQAYKLPWLLLFVLLSAVLAAGVSRWLAEPLNAMLRQRLTGISRRSVLPSR